jgi:Ser/Thr protein kinase RdoA (MazF antagonist)
VRLGENALFHVPALEALLRVARPQRSAESIARSVQLARRLRANGVPTPEPLTFDTMEQPFVSESGTVTVWRYYPEDRSRQFSFREFGGMLREFHRRAADLQDCLPAWRPLERTRRRLDEARRQEMPTGWLSILGRRLTEVEEGLEHLDSVLGRGPVHGDAHRGNVLLTREGPVLLDLDEVCVAPREWDLAPTLVTRHRFGTSREDWHRFSAAYGYDLAQSPAAVPLVRLRELSMTVWLLQQHGATPEIDAELDRRVGSLEEDDRNWTSWNPF